MVGRYDYGGVMGEVTFVPRTNNPNIAEDDGYLVVFVYKVWIYLYKLILHIIALFVCTFTRPFATLDFRWPRRSGMPRRGWYSMRRQWN